MIVSIFGFGKLDIRLPLLSYISIGFVEREREMRGDWIAIFGLYK